MYILDKIRYYFLSESIKKIFSVSEYALFKKDISLNHRFRLDIRNKRLRYSYNYNILKLVTNIYIKKIEENWCIMYDTKMGLIGKEVIYKSFSKLSDCYESFNIDPFIRYSDAYSFDSEFVRTIALQRDCIHQNMILSDIEYYSTPFKDLDQQTITSYGFILEPNLYFNRYGDIINRENSICSQTTRSEYIGFIINTQKTEDSIFEIEHLIENVQFLHPKFKVNIETCSNNLIIIVSKPYINSFLL